MEIDNHHCQIKTFGSEKSENRNHRLWRAVAGKENHAGESPFNARSFCPAAWSEPRLQWGPGRALGTAADGFGFCSFCVSGSHERNVTHDHSQSPAGLVLLVSTGGGLTAI